MKNSLAFATWLIAMLIAVPALARESDKERYAVNCSAMATVFTQIPELAEPMADSGKWFGEAYLSFRRARTGELRLSPKALDDRRELEFTDLRTTWERAPVVVEMRGAACSDWHATLADGISSGRIRMESDASFYRHAPLRTSQPSKDDIAQWSTVTRDAFSRWAAGGSLTPGGVRRAVEQSLAAPVPKYDIDAAMNRLNSAYANHARRLKMTFSSPWAGKASSTRWLLG